MYAAFWLDPDAKDANKRVVICQPFTKKPTTAWAVLRSAIHEKRTGGIVAGPEEDLRSLVERIDSDDQNWPNQADRMVAQITKLAQQCGCTVVFRQNMEPNGIAEQSQALLKNLRAGQPQLGSETDLRAVVRIPLTGHPKDIAEAMSQASKSGWILGEDEHCRRMLNGNIVTLQRFRTIESRAALEIEFPVYAKMAKKNSAGYSEEFQTTFNKTNEILDTILGPTAKRFKFVLLIREKQNSIIFCGTKSAQTVRQAIEQYMAHLQDEPSSSEPLSSQESKDAEEKSSDLMDEITKPAVQNCRFWKL